MCRSYGAGGEVIASVDAVETIAGGPMRKLKQRKPNDLGRCLTTLDMHHTLIAVVEMSLLSWLFAGLVPGVERQPLKKLKTDEHALLALLHRWRAEAKKAGHKITRIAVAYEAGRDGFWWARWLTAIDIDAHVIHALTKDSLHRSLTPSKLGKICKRCSLIWVGSSIVEIKSVSGQAWLLRRYR